MEEDIDELIDAGVAHCHACFVIDAIVSEIERAQDKLAGDAQKGRRI
jgi:hypothetical protein